MENAYLDKGRLPSVTATISISRDPKFIISAAEIEIPGQSEISPVLFPRLPPVFA